MTMKELAIMIDDLDSRFSFVLANMDAVRRTLQDDGTANFEKNCEALYATQMLFESVGAEIAGLTIHAMQLEAK